MMSRPRTLPPKSAKLHDVQQWFWNKLEKKRTHVKTIAWGKPYALCKSIKITEETKENPEGTYFKIVRHETPETINARNIAIRDSKLQQSNNSTLPNI